MLNFTFFIHDQPLFAHRDPAQWLQDLRHFSNKTLDVTAHASLSGGWAITVEGDETDLRWTCVALNLHAEQSPWDSTPPEQAAALEAYLAKVTA